MRRRRLRRGGRGDGQDGGEGQNQAADHGATVTGGGVVNGRIDRN